jgi:hypothetical protein
MNDPLDLTFLLQMPNCHTRKAAIDLQPLDEDTLADEPEGGDFLDDTFVCRFVKGDSVLSLILDFSFRPLLLLCGFAATRWGRCLSFSLRRACQCQVVIQCLSNPSSALHE